MPAVGSTTTAGSSFFGRFTGKKHAQEIVTNTAPAPPPSDFPIPPPPPAARSTTPAPATAVGSPDLNDSPSKRLQRLHKRESSFTSSLSNSVQELGSNVKRSVSLRSHRTHGSGGSVSEQSRPVSRYQPVSKSPPILSPIELTESISEGLAREPPTPSRSRGRLALATRSLSQRFKSYEHLPTTDSPEKAEGESPTPPVPSLEEAKAAMLSSSSSTPGLRRPFERPSLPSQAPSHARDIGTSYAAIDGGAMQQASTVGASLVYNFIHETARKRIGTIEYMRKLHDGNVFFFNTLHYSTASLSQMPSLVQAKLGRRATNYMVLGHSLPAVLDMAAGSPLEYLKALSSLLQEYETYQTLTGYDSSGNSIGRGRMGQMFKSGIGLGGRNGKGRRSSSAQDLAFDRQNSSSLSVPLSASDTGSSQDMPSPINPTGHDFHYLLTPHLPFEPDFSTTFSTLCDMLIDVYGKLLDLLSSPELCNQQLGDTFAKADKAVRKLLIASVVREFEDTTKNNVKGEIAGLGKLVLGGFV